MVHTNKRSLYLCAKHFLNLIKVLHGFHFVIKLRTQETTGGEEVIPPPWKQVESIVISYDRVNEMYGLEKRLVNGAFTMEFSKEHPMRWVRALDVKQIKRIRLEGKPVCVNGEMIQKMLCT